MKDYLIKRPMLLSGIICCIISFEGIYLPALLLITGVLLAVICGILFFKKARPELLLCIVLCLFMLCNTLGSLVRAESCGALDGCECKADLVLREVKYKGEEYHGAEIEVLRSDTLERGTKLFAFYTPAPIDAGEVFAADMVVSAIEENKGENYSNGIYLTASLENIKTNSQKSDFVFNGIAELRKYIKETAFANMEYKAAATVCAIIFGDRDYFDDVFYSNVKGAGVSHVMVVSGMHLSILVMICCFFIDKFTYNRFIKAIIMLFVVLCLTALCGFTKSMLRAGMTYLFMAIALILNRNSTPDNTLGAALTVILIFSPFAIHSLALQLSFLSTFGILVVALPTLSFIRRNKIIKNKILFYLISVAVTSVAAYILTLPLIIYKLGYISTVAIITNLLISHAVTAALFLNFAGLVLNLILPAVAKPVFLASEIVVTYINSVIDCLGTLPFSTIRVPVINVIPALILIILIFKFLLACKVRHNMIKLKKLRQKITDEGGKTLKWQ